MIYPTDTTRFYHNPDYCIIPEAIIKRDTAKFKQQQSQPKPHKFRTVDVAGAETETPQHLNNAEAAVTGIKINLDESLAGVSIVNQ